MTVVGVAADTRYRELRKAWMTVYFPADQFFFFQPGSVLVRTQLGPEALRAELTARVAQAMPGALVDTVEPLGRLLARSSPVRGRLSPWLARSRSSPSAWPWLASTGALLRRTATPARAGDPRCPWCEPSSTGSARGGPRRHRGFGGCADWRVGRRADDARAWRGALRGLARHDSLVYLLVLVAVPLLVVSAVWGARARGRTDRRSSHAAIGLAGPAAHRRRAHLRIRVICGSQRASAPPAAYLRLISPPWKLRSRRSSSCGAPAASTRAAKPSSTASCG